MHFLNMMKQHKLDEIIKHLEFELNNQSGIMFAYIYGSVLSSDNPRDIDIAVYLFPADFENLSRDGEISLSFAIPLEMELEKQLKRKADVQVLNRAPLAFRYRVIADGKVIVDKDSNTRCDFEYISRVEYYDFSPKRKEYLQEAMT
jgi:predicted nucleotidyltransferase